MFGSPRRKKTKNNEEYETALNNLEDIRLKENLEDNTQVFNFLIEKYLKNEL